MNEGISHHNHICVLHMDDNRGIEKHERVENSSMVGGVIGIFIRFFHRR